MALGAMFAVIALMIAGVQLADLAPQLLAATAAGPNPDSPLRDVLRIPAYVIMIAVALPLILALIGIIGSRRF